MLAPPIRSPIAISEWMAGEDTTTQVRTYVDLAWVEASRESLSGAAQNTYVDWSQFPQGREMIFTRGKENILCASLFLRFDFFVKKDRIGKCPRGETGYTRSA